MKLVIPTVLSISVALAGAALAQGALSPARQAVMTAHEEAAKAADPAFAGFDARRGEALFLGKHTGGKTETPSCTTCHTADVRNTGQTRAGKAIEPMAASVNPKRFTDPKDVAKWFKRNCNDVLGRACSETEKGDVLTYLLSR